MLQNLNKYKTKNRHHYFTRCLFFYKNLFKKKMEKTKLKVSVTTFRQTNLKIKYALKFLFIQILQHCKYTIEFLKYANIVFNIYFYRRYTMEPIVVVSYKFFNLWKFFQNNFFISISKISHHCFSFSTVILENPVLYFDILVSETPKIGASSLAVLPEIKINFSTSFILVEF